MRQAQAQAISTWLYVSAGEDGPALFNKIVPHIDKLSSAIFSPVDPRFAIEYENNYGLDELRKAEIAARWLTREFSSVDRSLDMLYASCVDYSLKYGAAVMKCGWGHDGMTARILPHWQFGVYVESQTDLDQQEAMCETTYMTAEELWRRIMHRADAREIYQRALAHAKKGAREDVRPSGLHNVLPPAQIGTGETADQGPQGGGIVDVASTPMMPVVAPEIAAALIEAHELWVVNDETGDYTTIEIVEPDIIIEPRMMRRNRFFPHAHPYELVVINPQIGYAWGHSEVSDLVPLQRLLSARLLDVKHLMSLQYRRIRAFIGFSGNNDETYDQLNQTGWIAQEMPGAKVDDLTPPMPEGWTNEIEMISKMFDEMAGFDNVMSGRGEEGIRSGNHFQGAVRMASPRLRDRALRAERQYARFGEKMLWLAAEKDASAHWLDPKDLEGKTDFMLSQLQDDARVIVDSHSSSPIYEQDHANLAAFGLKAGAIDAADTIDMLPFPRRDTLRDKLEMRQQKAAEEKQRLMAQLPVEVQAELAFGIKPSGGGADHHRK